jgi:hypothetical protein
MMQQIGDVELVQVDRCVASVESATVDLRGVYATL